MWARRSVSALGIAALFGTLAASGALAEDEGDAMGGASGREPFEVCEPAAIPFDPDTIQLTGRWSADDDGIFESVAVSEETAGPALPSAPLRPEGWPTVTSGRGDLRLSLPPGFGVGDASGAIFANRIPGDDGRWVQLMAEGPRAQDFPPPGPDEPLDDWVERRWLGSEEPLELPTTRTLLLPAGEALEWRGTIRADPVRTLLLYAIRTPAGVAFVAIDGPPEEMELLAADIDLILHLLEVE